MRDRGHVRKLGELEAVVMQLMWARSEPASVRDIVGELDREREFGLHNGHDSHGQPQPQATFDPANGGTRVQLPSGCHASAIFCGSDRGCLDEGADDRTTALVQFLGQLEPAELARIRSALDAPAETSPSDGADDPSARRWSLGRRR